MQSPSPAWWAALLGNKRRTKSCSEKSGLADRQSPTMPTTMAYGKRPRTQTGS